MLQPGIWEELTFRGITIPILLNRYTQKTAIIISSVMFAIAHSINLIGGNPIFVLFQVVYTFFMGLVFGSLFIKSNSLIPSIILHYLVDTVGLALITTVISDFFLLIIFYAGFIGILPTVFALIFIKLFTKN